MLQEVRNLFVVQPTHDQNRRRDARLAKQDSLLEERHSEAGRTEGLEMPRHLEQAMPVCVRLENRQYPRRAHRRLDGAVVGGQLVEVDLGVGRPSHVVGADDHRLEGHGARVPVSGGEPEAPGSLGSLLITSPRAARGRG